jgi:hypothetical protein
MNKVGSSSKQTTAYHARLNIHPITKENLKLLDQAYKES